MRGKMGHSLVADSKPSWPPAARTVIAICTMAAGYFLK